MKQNRLNTLVFPFLKGYIIAVIQQEKGANIASWYISVYILKARNSTPIALMQPRTEHLAVKTKVWWGVCSVKQLILEVFEFEVLTF